MKQIGKLPEGQVQLLLLMRAAKHPKFIKWLAQQLKECDRPKNLQKFQARLRCYFDEEESCSMNVQKAVQELFKLLTELSDPSLNVFLWKHIPQSIIES